MDLSAVRSVMTPAPKVVDAETDMRTAWALMEQLGVRHLPVVHKGDLTGIVSERDLRGARAVLASCPGELGPPVLALCSRDLYVVQPDDPIDDVATQMANRRLGAAVVVEGEMVVGIITTTDLCRELARLVGRQRTT